MSRKKDILPESSETRPRRPARERLQGCVLEELWSIWRANPRVPSVRSRRSWAISRNANPRLVDGWFLRRKTCAKKAGQLILGGPYDLPLEPLTATATIEPELAVLADLPSDDTLVYPPDIDDFNDVEASSDTVFDEDTPLGPESTGAPAYKHLKVHQHSPANPAEHSEPKSSSADLYATEDHGDENVSFKIPSLPVCNQGQRRLSDFTCILCSVNPAQVEVPSTCDTTFDSRENLFVPCPRFDFLPDTLSELSAIPFLFRTPSAILPNNAAQHPSVENWTIVEDELGRLVNDGKLDFSFLDTPRLSFMEWLD